jgi:hypothetical protein
MGTGIPRVGNLPTVPEPVYTVPAPGTVTYRTVNDTVLNVTRGTTGNRGYGPFHSSCNLAKAARTSIDVRRAFREVTRP